MTGRVLLVNPQSTSWNQLAHWLREAGFGTESVATFEEARRRLTTTGPDVLVTEVRLGAFNGLHLAIVGRACRPALVAIVIGPPDAVLAKEADHHDAIYLIEPVTEDELVAQVATWLQEIARQRRLLRKHVMESVSVECGESPARIGGFRSGLRAAPDDTSDARLTFVMREGCVNTSVMRANLDDALRALNLPVDYTAIDSRALARTDPRAGYPPPTVICRNRDLFGMPEPVPPFSEPSCRRYPDGVPSAAAIQDRLKAVLGL